MEVGDAADEPIMAVRELLYNARNSDSTRLSDYDDDGQPDILCHDTSSGQHWIDNGASYGSSDWSIIIPNGWCVGSNQRVFKGDFNDDGYVDLLCHDISTGKHWVDYATSGGHFGGTDWAIDGGWCKGSTEELLVGDFNGDGSADLLCHQTETGKLWVDYADDDGRFNGTDWVRDAGWCRGSTERPYVGFFDDDDNADLLCFEQSTGTKWVDLANSDGEFNGTNWARTDGWCSHAGGTLLIGDFNGDFVDDLLCTDKVTPRMWFDYSNGDGHFDGTDATTTNGFCQMSSGRLFVGQRTWTEYRIHNLDVTITHHSEGHLVCYEKSTGEVHVDEDLDGHPDQSTGNTGWCAQSTGEVH